MAADDDIGNVIENEELLLKVNLIHEHAHVHGDTAHVHRHGHFGHFHANGGVREVMHKGHHNHTHGHGHDHPHDEAETLNKLLAMLDHWIDHSDSHAESYREWAIKASESGEEEIAREIHLAIDDNDTVKDHLKRARAILAAKLVLKR
jgi:hypothetical protein